MRAPPGILRAVVEPRIHPTAIVDPKAQIDPTASIGAYSVIGPNVSIAAGVSIASHVVVSGWTDIGEDARLWPFAAIGHEPQDRSYGGWRSFVRVGPRTLIHESATIHRGTTEDSETIVGADCMLMNNAHVAHNCTVGDFVTIASGAVLAGYVTVGERAFISGNAAVHQFCRIGRLAMIAGIARARRDVPPFATLSHDTRIDGLNIIGMKRAGISREARGELMRMVRVLRGNPGQLKTVVAQLANEMATPEAREFIHFILEPSKRGCGAFAPRDTRE